MKTPEEIYAQDRQEFGSKHYAYPGRRVIPLRSGNYAVAERLPSGKLVAIVSDLAEVLALVLDAPVDPYKENKPNEISFDELGDLENLDL